MHRIRHASDCKLNETKAALLPHIAGTMGACAGHEGRTHWYCVQTFGLQCFPMGIIDVLQVEVVVVLGSAWSPAGELWGCAAMKATWSIQPAAFTLPLLWS